MNLLATSLRLRDFPLLFSAIETPDQATGWKVLSLRNRADMALPEPKSSHNAVTNKNVPISNALDRNGILLVRDGKTLDMSA